MACLAMNSALLLYVAHFCVSTASRDYNHYSYVHQVFFSMKMSEGKGSSTLPWIEQGENRPCDRQVDESDNSPFIRIVPVETGKKPPVLKKKDGQNMDCPKPEDAWLRPRTCKKKTGTLSFATLSVPPATYGVWNQVMQVYKDRHEEKTNNLQPNLKTGPLIKELMDAFDQAFRDARKREYAAGWNVLILIDGLRGTPDEKPKADILCWPNGIGSTAKALSIVATAGGQHITSKASFGTGAFISLHVPKKEFRIEITTTDSQQAQLYESANFREVDLYQVSVDNELFCGKGGKCQFFTMFVTNHGRHSAIWSDIVRSPDIWENGRWEESKVRQIFDKHKNSSRYVADSLSSDGEPSTNSPYWWIILTVIACCIVIGLLIWWFVCGCRCCTCCEDDYNVEEWASTEWAYRR